MKFIGLPLILVAMLLTLSILSAAQEGEEALRIYDQIKNVSLDEQRVAEVESLVIKRDAAVFHLNKGKLCLFQPVEGKVTGAVFLGEGVFEFSPPTEIERYQLKRFTKKEALSEGFDELCLWFADSTEAELEHNFSFSEGKLPGRFTVMTKDCRRRLPAGESQKLGCHVLEGILADSLSGLSGPEHEGGFFYADIKTDELDRLFYTFNPTEVDEVVLKKLAPGYVKERDQICSFHREADYLKNPSVMDRPILHENKDEIKVTHYKMEAEISITEKLSALMEIDFETLVDGVRIIDFEMHPDLKMERVTNEEGDSLCFIQEKDQYGVSVLLSRPARSGETRKLSFQYSGKIIEQGYWLQDLYMKSTTYWYPRYGYRQRATYDLLFKCPRGYELVSIGTKDREWVEGDFRCSRWVEDFPVSVASFTYGNFDKYEKTVEGIPPVSVYHLSEVHRKTGLKYAKSKENVAADVLNSLNFFQTIYGQCPFSKIAATEMAASYGQGLPGLLRLSFWTFTGESQFQEEKFADESFRAHEVAHQWWGHIVGPETYHDAWLSEGFAEYSGAWYAQMSMKDNQAFFDELEEWRKDIMGKGYRWEEGSKVGPLWLGYRLNSSKSQDYWNLIYEKGAYVLHMLRNLMMDFETRSDSSFIAMMRDFVETYYGKEVSTEDFKEIVEKHVGEDMDWFFDQWVYGVDIPTYKFSYITKPTLEGKYIVSCEVDQENVSEDFRMWVPILLDFGMNQHAILRLWVDKPHNEYQLPKAPLRPREVTLNPAHAVLCEVKNK